ncbi:MAG: hypothetical protein EOP85_10615, partial [Verrucomicrobiaceae bacterium]
MKPRQIHGSVLPAASVVFLALAGAALAAPVTLKTNDEFGTSSFNAVGQWNNDAAPSPGNEYFSSTYTLRTPADTGATYTFAGDSLTMQAGSRLLGKSLGTQTINFTNGAGLILNGGLLNQANTSTTAFTLNVGGKISVTAASSMGAAGSGTANTTSENLNIDAVISGSGDLTIAGNLNGNGNTGITRFNAANPDYTGTVIVAQPSVISSLTHRLLQLGNVNSLQKATLSIVTTGPNPVSFNQNANTAPFNIGGLSGTSTQRLSDTAGNPVNLNVGGNNASTTFSGTLTGAGNLTKSGTGTLTFSGINAYSGNTTVAAGILEMAYATLSDTSTVTITAGAKLNLTHNKVDRVTSLVLGSETKGPGTYHKDNSNGFITGTGSILVASGPPGAQEVVLIASDPVAATATTSINGDIGNWSQAGVPAAPNNYHTGIFTLRTPSSTTSETITFGGSTLSLNTGGRLLGKAAAGVNGNTSVQTLNVNLIFNGGNIDQAGGNTSSTLVINGPVQSLAPASVGSLANTTNFETLDFAGPISGDSEINIAGAANGGANRGLVRFSAANPFTGTVNVQQPGTNTIQSPLHRLLQLGHVNALQNATLN